MTFTLYPSPLPSPSPGITPTQIETANTSIAAVWVLITGILVFMMQPGFAMLEVGNVRVKAGPHVLLKNILDAATGSIIWWAVGYAFAFGESQNQFIGTSGFFTTDIPTEYAEATQYWSKWFFQWAFAATAATIVSGAVAERCQFRAYIVYTIAITGFIYPVVVHWVWSENGWLTFQCEECSVFGGTNGLMDFAGSGVVHMVGGGAALVAAFILGPRFGRFNRDGDIIYIQGQSTALSTLGTFILWVGWYGFNAGSLIFIEDGMDVAGLVAVNTTLSICSSCISTLILNSLWGYPLHITPALNGLLGGAVAITAGCAFVEPYAAVAIGVIASLFYMASSTLLRKLHIDDPVDAAPVHFFCGLWGILAVGFFATKNNTERALGYASDWGVFYGGSGQQLGIQFLGMIVIGVWALTLSSLMFIVLKYSGWFRMSNDEELRGLNHSMHQDIEMNIDHLSSQHRGTNIALNNVVMTANNHYSQVQMTNQQFGQQVPNLGQQQLQQNNYGNHNNLNGQINGPQMQYYNNGQQQQQQQQWYQMEQQQQYNQQQLTHRQGPNLSLSNSNGSYRPR